MTIYTDIVTHLKTKRKDDETLVAFATRVAKKVNALSDPDWKQLPGSLQVWTNKVQEAIEARTEDQDPVIPTEVSNEEGSSTFQLGWPEEEAAETVADGEVNEGAPEEDDSDDDSDDETDDDDTADEEEEASEEETEQPSKPTKEESVRRVAKEPKQKPEKKGKQVSAPKEEKEKKAPKTAKSTEAKVGRSSGFGDKDTIKLLAKENPHREGSSRYKRWSKYKEGMTVAAALKAGFNYGNLRHSVDDGHIKIIKTKAA